MNESLRNEKEEEGNTLDNINQILKLSRNNLERYEEDARLQRYDSSGTEGDIAEEGKLYQNFIKEKKQLFLSDKKSAAAKDSANS